LSDRPKFLDAVEPTVWFGSASLVIVFCIYGGLFTEHAANLFTATQAFIADQLGWFYIVSVSFFLAFVVWLLLSPYGKIKLGAEDDEPEFSYFAWFTMLFSAGMGIGLVFWGIAEPMMHYMAPPLAEAGSQAALMESMKFTFFH
jgi:choline/glycine/proline betaine transport protein